MTIQGHILFIAFLFALGACIGSFLNVVVWRLPRIEPQPNDSYVRWLVRVISGLSHPPSHCPKCDHLLAWKDNIPVFGWIFLRGRCRYCKAPISSRYPIVEFCTGAMLVFFYVMFFLLRISPCVRKPEKHPITELLVEVAHPMTSILQDWPMFALLMFMVCALLAVSLIDADLFIIPLEIPWLMALVGCVAHALIDHRHVPGAVNVDPLGIGGALAIGGGLGLLLSIVLFQLGIMPRSFPDGEPELEVDKQRKADGEPESPQVKTGPDADRALLRREMGKEMLFLMPPMAGAIVAAAIALYSRPAANELTRLMSHDWLSGLSGAVLGALVGAALVWLSRIIGTLALGRLSMGLGDVHLMFGVGAILGAGPVTVAFFLAPFAGLAVGVWALITRKQHELPYGPYLSLASAAVLICYCPIADYLRPGLIGMADLLRNVLGA